MMKTLQILVLLISFNGIVFAQDTVVNYSHGAGFYDSSFDLTLTSSIPSLQIVYTLDGSNPTTSANAITADSPCLIAINPDDTSHRGLTPGVVVRAIIKNGNQFVASPKSQTYIFPEKVKTQIFPGKNWPIEKYSSVNKHNIDYAMDSFVVYDQQYQDSIITSLLSIPTLCVATDNANLFDAKTGLYVNSNKEGVDWERECSFELIDTDSTQKFQLNAGIRLKGGWSRQNFNPKYSLRLLFKDEYGAKKLKYPLFGYEGAKTFNHIDLRTEQNCAWTLDEGIAKYNTFIRDAFSRDAQRDMGRAYMRSNYYHLYINGMYWGIYTIQEHVDKDYAQSYFGGKEEDYDIFKSDELVDGNADAYKELWELTQKGFETNEKYYAIEGKNADGLPVKGMKVYVDIDNLIDYMVLVFYTGNIDGPCSKWGQNKTGANFISLKDRSNNSDGFKFFALDFEYSMLYEKVYIAEGLTENRVNIGDLKDGNKMDITSFAEFNPQWLHYKLSKNAEYRDRFANRAYYLLKENGIFTPGKNLERFNIRADQVDEAIIAESARWGDAQTSKGSPFTKKDWDLEISNLRDTFFAQRTDIVIKQLSDAGLFATLLPPDITVAGKTNTVDTFQLTDNADISIANASEDGTVYYTLDGSDPRANNGEIASVANAIDAASKDFNTANSMVIKARTKSGDAWSPLRTLAVFADIAKEDYSALKITELNYHPLPEIVGTDTTDGDDFEFIELKNTGTNALNISGLRIDSAVRFVAPNNTILAPQQYFVIASKPAKFYKRYGLVASGNFSGKLANSGEYILIEDSLHNAIISFTYSDKEPWPKKADGAGYTLVSVESNPTGNPQDYNYWKLSENIHGHPFFYTTYTATDIKQPVDIQFSIYPNPATSYLKIEDKGLSSVESTLTMFDISGKMVYKQQFNNELTLQVKSMNIKEGLYFIKIQNNNGVNVEKIMIK